MGAGAFQVILVGLFSLIHPVFATSLQNNETAFEIKILIVPAFQSRMISGGSLEGGDVFGTTIGGNVTGHFPEGYVVLRASSNAGYRELIQLIKKKISSYPCSCGDFVQISGYANHFIEFDPVTKRYKRFEFHDYNHDRILTGKYFLFIEPIFVSKKKIWLDFEIRENICTAQANHEPEKYFKEELFDRVVEMGKDQILLVSFTTPKFDSKYRGSAFWFIIRVKNKRE
jgi:hypothetical protein